MCPRPCRRCTLSISILVSRLSVCLPTKAWSLPHMRLCHTRVSATHAPLIACIHPLAKRQKHTPPTLIFVEGLRFVFVTRALVLHILLLPSLGVLLFALVVQCAIVPGLHPRDMNGTCVSVIWAYLLVVFFFLSLLLLEYTPLHPRPLYIYHPLSCRLFFTSLW